MAVHNFPVFPRYQWTREVQILHPHANKVNGDSLKAVGKYNQKFKLTKRSVCGFVKGKYVLLIRFEFIWGKWDKHASQTCLLSFRSGYTHRHGLFHLLMLSCAVIRKDHTQLGTPVVILGSGWCNHHKHEQLLHIRVFLLDVYCIPFHHCSLIISDPIFMSRVLVHPILHSWTKVWVWSRVFLAIPKMGWDQVLLYMNGTHLGSFGNVVALELFVWRYG